MERDHLRQRLRIGRTGNNRVFLTLLGGGAFGNRASWITDSVERALKLYEDWDLDVAIVSSVASKPAVRQLVASQLCRRMSLPKRRPAAKQTRGHARLRQERRQEIYSNNDQHGC